MDTCLVTWYLTDNYISVLKKMICTAEKRSPDDVFFIYAVEERGSEYFAFHCGEFSLCH